LKKKLRTGLKFRRATLYLIPAKVLLRRPELIARSLRWVNQKPC
jgi:hypothetical protein